jgi:hypothetical protein
MRFARSESHIKVPEECARCGQRSAQAARADRVTLTATRTGPAGSEIACFLPRQLPRPPTQTKAVLGPKRVTPAAAWGSLFALNAKIVDHDAG